MRANVILAAAAAGGLATSTSADVIFQDGTFSDTNWSQIEIFGTGTATSMQMPAGGNPGQFRHITNNLGAGSGALLRAFHHYGSTQATRYEPMVSGAITALDCSIDFQPISGPTGGQGIAFALKQSQVVYFAMPIAVQNNPVWQTHAVAGLTAASFVRADGQAGTPNFTASGQPIRFGLLTYNSANPSGTAFTTEAGYDNLVVRVIPAPGAVAALGLGLVPGAQRRRRQGP